MLLPAFLVLVAGLGVATSISSVSRAQSNDADSERSKLYSLSGVATTDDSNMPRAARKGSVWMFKFLAESGVPYGFACTDIHDVKFIVGTDYLGWSSGTRLMRRAPTRATLYFNSDAAPLVAQCARTECLFCPLFIKVNGSAGPSVRATPRRQSRAAANDTRPQTRKHYAFDVDLRAHNLVRAGLAAQSDGRLNDAMRSFNAALAVHRNYFYALQSRGNLYAMLGKRDLAHADCASYRATYKYGPDDIGLCGNIYLLLGEYDRAVSEFSKVLATDPEDDALRYSRGNAYLMKGSYANAVADFSRLISARDNPQVRLNRGIAYYLSSRYDDAVRDYTAGLKVDPNAVELPLWRHLARMKAREDDSSEFPGQPVSGTERWAVAASDFFQDKITGKQFVDIAAQEDGPKPGVQWRSCYALFFAGESALLRGSPDEATAFRSDAELICPKWLFAVRGALNAERRSTH